PARTRRAISIRSTSASREAARRRKTCSTNITAHGAVRSIRFTPTRLIEAGTMPVMAGLVPAIHGNSRNGNSRKNYSTPGAGNIRIAAAICLGPLMPREPLLRQRVRLFNKLIDEYVHNACMILTFATAFRPNFVKMPREAWLAEINKTPLKRRAEYKRSVIEHGLDSEFVSDAIAHHEKLLSWMDASLQTGGYLAGER